MISAKKDIQKYLFLIFAFFVIVLLIFKPILLDDNRYGCVPLEQSFLADKKSIPAHLNGFPDSSIIKYKTYTDFNKDYINLHLPKAEILSKTFKDRKKAPYDTSRLLGLSLPGHPLTDVFNPLNYISFFCDSGNLIIYKSIFYLLAGFLFMSFLIKRIIIIEDKNLILTGSLLYTLMPNNFHYLHWDNYIGVTMTLPLLYIGIILLINQKYFNAILSLTAYGSFSIIINMAELFFYNTAFGIIFLVTYVSLVKYDYKILIKIIFTFIFSILAVSLLTLPQLIYSFEYLAQLQREGNFSMTMIDHKYPYFPREKSQYLGLIGLPCFWKTQHNIILNVTLIFLISLNFINYKNSNFLIKSTIITFLFNTIFLFIGYIDLPVYGFKFYNLFANQVRSINTFTLLSTILIINGLIIFIQLLIDKDNTKKSNYFNVLLILNSAVIFLFIFIIINPVEVDDFEWINDHIVFEYSIYTFAFSFALLFAFRFFDLYKSKKVLLTLIPIIISTPYILIAKVTIPFYNSSDLIHLNESNKSEFATRSLVISEETEHINARNWQAFCGTYMWSMGENPITGYDTGLTKSSAKVLRDFWDIDDYMELKNNKQYNWINWHEYWVTPSPKSLISHENNNTRLKPNYFDKLRLLGVSRIYTNYILDNLCINDTRFDFNLYDLNLSSPFSIVYGHTKEQISNFLLNCQLHELNSTTIINLPKDNFSILENGLPTFDITSEYGFLVLPYDFSNDFYVKTNNNEFVKRDDATGFFIIDLSQFKEFTIYYNNSKFNNLSYIMLFSLIILFLFIFFNYYKSKISYH